MTNERRIISRLEMCQYDTDALAQGHPHPHAGILQKRAIILIIIGRFYPKLNFTIFYDYKPMYEIWIQYTNQSFLKKNIGRKTSIEGDKGP